MWKFIVDVVNDFISSLQPDVGRGFLHVSNVFLFTFLNYIHQHIDQREVFLNFYLTILITDISDSAIPFNL